jgi:hypothetical protein
MPTDLSVALERKTALKSQLQREECSGGLLIPLAMSILSMIMAVVSPSFADAVIISGLY